MTLKKKKKFYHRDIKFIIVFIHTPVSDMGCKPGNPHWKHLLSGSAAPTASHDNNWNIVTIITKIRTWDANTYICKSLNRSMYNYNDHLFENIVVHFNSGKDNHINRSVYNDNSWSQKVILKA